MAWTCTAYGCEGRRQDCVASAARAPPGPSLRIHESHTIRRTVVRIDGSPPPGSSATHGPLRPIFPSRPGKNVAGWVDAADRSSSQAGTFREGFVQTKDEFLEEVRVPRRIPPSGGLLGAATVRSPKAGWFVGSSQTPSTVVGWWGPRSVLVAPCPAGRRHVSPQGRVGIGRDLPPPSPCFPGGGSRTVQDRSFLSPPGSAPHALPPRASLDQSAIAISHPLVSHLPPRPLPALVRRARFRRGR